MPAKTVTRQRQTDFGIDAASLVVLLVLVLAAAAKFLPVPSAGDLDLPSFYGHTTSR